MRILFDQGTPVPLRRSLPGHEIVTVFERGWGALQNGDLLRTADAEGIEAIITTDQNLRHQQVMAGRRLAILVLMTTKWRTISRHTDSVSHGLSKLVPGAYLELPFIPPP